MVCLALRNLLSKLHCFSFQPKLISVFTWSGQSLRYQHPFLLNLTPLPGQAWHSSSFQTMRCMAQRLLNRQPPGCQQPYNYRGQQTAIQRLKTAFQVNTAGGVLLPTTTTDGIMPHVQRAAVRGAGRPQALSMSQPYLSNPVLHCTMTSTASTPLP
jgi:hypothetical protein